MMSRRESKEKTLIKCLKAPYRALIHVRNFYIYSMIQCSGHVGSGGNIPARQINGLPRAYSVNLERQKSANLTLDEDFRELLKAASARRLTSIIQSEDDALCRQKSDEKLGFPEPVYMKRSSTVTGMGRIDEEETCEFSAGDVKVRANALRTSRSHR